MNGKNNQSSHAIQQAFTYLSNALYLPKHDYSLKRRDTALLALDTLRVSDIYLAIEAKFRHEQLTPQEYVFYALVTDNVMTLDANMLNHMLQKCDDLPRLLRQSLSLTIAALRFANNQTPALRERLHQALINELCSDREAHNLHRSVFTNLAGIRLTGLDSTVERTNRNRGTYSPDLSFCDLRGAVFTNCDFDNMALRYCDVSDAAFKNVRNTKKHGGSEFDLIFSLAKRATFNNVVANNTNWQFADFSDAVFNHCHLGNTHVSDSNFSRARLHNTSILGGDRGEQRDTNFSYADLTTAEIRRVSYDRNIYFDAKWINPASPADLHSEIDRIAKKYLECESYLSQSDISAFQKLLRHDVVRYVSSLDATDEEKSNLLKQVLEHDLFHYEFMQPTKTLVAGGFPRQERPLVLFSQYDDSKHTFGLKGASVAVYQAIYARGTELLGRLANAMKSTTDLQLFTSELEAGVISDLESTKREMKERGASDADLSQSPAEVIEGLLHHVPDKLAGTDQDTLKALLLANLDFGRISKQAFDAALAANEQIDEREIINSISLFHPLTSLEYHAATNCLAPYSYSGNNGAYHNADELIKAYTDPARLTPPVATPAPSKVSATLFAVGAADSHPQEAEALREVNSLRA